MSEVTYQPGDDVAIRGTVTGIVRDGRGQGYYVKPDDPYHLKAFFILEGDIIGLIDEVEGDSDGDPV